MPVPFLLGIYIAVLGLMVGSYLNVVIYRLPRGLSTVMPRSRCPGCEAPIRALDNIPLVSFLFLGGRCRHCRTPISWQYPLTELATGLLFVACYARFGLTLDALAGALFCALMLALAAIDFEHFLLLDRLTLPGIAIGLLVQPLLGWAGSFGAPLPWGRFLAGLWGAALGAGILLAVVKGWYLLRKEEGMGLGDVKMLALIGAFLGWKGVLVCLFFASLSGAVVGLALILARRGAGFKTQLPFGVFLALGGLITLFFGEAIAAFYGGLLAPPG